MRHQRSFFVILFSLLALCAPAGWAQDGLRGAWSRNSHGASIISAFAEVAAADFDNDQKPDGAVLLRAGQVDGQRSFRIELHLTAGRNSSISFYAAETDLSVSALDVNRDGAPDIVIERALTHERVKVYLNNGNGEFQPSSEQFAAWDDSAPGWRATISVQDLPVAFLPPARGFEVAESKSTIVADGQNAGEPASWSEALPVQCGPSSASATRAPPSFLFL